MPPLKPHWSQPSHAEIQQVLLGESEYASKSISKVSLAAGSLFARLSFPPCTIAHAPSYATVQMDTAKHLHFNSDLLFINHSCEPSLHFDMTKMEIVVGPSGLQAGDELTFFYPSTEWDMAQPFDCLCGTRSCRGRISGAKDMTLRQLDGLWLNRHIYDLLKSRDAPWDGGLPESDGVRCTRV